MTPCPLSPYREMPQYIYSWGPRGNLPGAMSRKGQQCRLLARGSMNSALVEFDDGYLAVISRNALRKPLAQYIAQVYRPQERCA